MKNSQVILDKLKELFPNAHCELNYSNEFELLVAVVLSAQTTDIKVNAVTKELFKYFPNARALFHSDIEDLKRIIKPLGLANNKSNNLIKLSRSIWLDYDNKVPSTREELMKLAGVGRKTANVVLAEAFNQPEIAVDTHVERVSKRLTLVPKDASVEKCEEILRNTISQDRWIEAHHLFIHFGRYKCKAIKPDCETCPFQDICQK